PGAARSSPRRPNSTEHGDRAHEDAPHRRGDPTLPPRARAGPRAGGRPLRARVPTVEARRPRRRDPAPAGLPRPSPERPRRREMDRARHPGAPRPGRVRAHAGRHRGGALRGSRAGVLLLALATAAACGPLGPALDQVVSLSDSLTVRLQDTTAAGPVDLSGRPVAFALSVYPGGGPGANVALVTSDTARAPLAADTVTTRVGIAAVKLRLLAGPLPDSAVV